MVDGNRNSTAEKQVDYALTDLSTIPDIARKNSQAIQICFEHVLGMPLDSPDETLARHSCGFDEAVRSDSHRRQITAEVFDGLVVQRVHFEDVFAQQRLEVSIQHDLMRRDTIWLALPVDDV